MTELRKRKNSTIILVYLLIIIPVIFFLFFQLRSTVQQGIDRDLQTAINDLDRFLGEEFHDRWTREHPLPEEKYEKIIDQLSHEARQLKVTYLYTMVREGDQVYFVISSETKKDRDEGTPSLFYNPYPHPPRAVLEAFDADEPYIYASYENQWDSFYSLFVPRVTPKGKTYILAADIRRDQKKRMLQNSLYSLFSMIFIMLVTVIPFFLILQAESRKKARSLEKQLYTDLHSGLPNRRRFLLDYETREKDVLSAVMFDLDSFGEVNNLFGGQVGDQVLNYMRDNILRFCVASDILYKFPADEFVLLLEGKERGEVLKQVKEILETFSRESFTVKGQAINLSVRAGVIHNPPSRHKLLSSVNIAKNLARRESCGYVEFDETMEREEQYVENLRLLSSLKEALDENRVIPYYQGIARNSDGVIEKYEALVRMVDSEGKLLPPSQFLPLAKKSKLYKRITLAMIDRITKDFSTREEMVSLNLTVLDLTDRETMEHLYSRVREYALKDRITVEIVESESLFKVENYSEILNEIRQYGIYISIDDFGSGYSNFGYLSAIPMDILKIDGSLIRELLTDRQSEAVVTAIAAFSRDLEIPLVAEYVENERTMARLKSMGIEYSQGYYIGKPCPLDELP
ncbi:MAG: bifunctional diguanylate cyclase/phosphodiesterase [Spirochaetales bacterium]|nr:bifunctional diguanylate cyclase/phosphodiesterase [Spirochaetales bacterium]